MDLSRGIFGDDQEDAEVSGFLRVSSLVERGGVTLVYGLLGASFRKESDKTLEGRMCYGRIVRRSTLVWRVNSYIWLKSNSNSPRRSTRQKQSVIPQTQGRHFSPLLYQNSPVILERGMIEREKRPAAVHEPSHAS
jgi:hypothetical protein